VAPGQNSLLQTHASGSSEPRFCTEIAKDDVLGFVDRGSYSTLTCYPGKTLANNYSLNTVDICPVGALLNRDFRFRARAWFLSAAPSVCTGCSRGCSIHADFMGQDTYRFRPRENDAINIQNDSHLNTASAYLWIVVMHRTADKLRNSMNIDTESDKLTCKVLLRSDKSSTELRNMMNRTWYSGA